MNVNEHNHHRLEELTGSDFEIADHQPDIRGWDIRAGVDKIGEVDDLLFNRESRKVRYVVTKLDDTARTVLIPIGLVSLDDDKDEVILNQTVYANMAHLPPYTKGTLTPAQELEIRNLLLEHKPTTAVTVYEQHPDDFYEHSHFDDSRFRRRPPGTGTSGERNIL